MRAGSGRRGCPNPNSGPEGGEGGERPGKNITGDCGGVSDIGESVPGNGRIAAGITLAEGAGSGRRDSTNPDPKKGEGSRGEGVADGGGGVMNTDGPSAENACTAAA